MQPSRYDDHASWFIGYSRDWTSTSSPLLPAELSGVEVLDLACGWGPLSRDLAERGALVTGVELSEPLLAQARALENREQRGIRYLQGDASTLRWWDERPFDGVVCNMALMDIDDLDGTIGTVDAVLRPGGWFHLSLLHPCFPGEATPAVRRCRAGHRSVGTAPRAGGPPRRPGFAATSAPITASCRRT